MEVCKTNVVSQTGDRGDVLGIAVLLGVFLLTIVGIIFVQEGARRIPIAVSYTHLRAHETS